MVNTQYKHILLIHTYIERYSFTHIHINQWPMKDNGVKMLENQILLVS